MRIDMNGLIYALSYALDSVEAELVGVSENHAKWVSYISVIVGKSYGLTYEQLSDLAACAALHDNALTQYIAEEWNKNGVVKLESHSVYGQENIKGFPFYKSVDGFITYHHENADGSGPFGKVASETPLAAQIIHLADMVDVVCKLKNVSQDNYDKIINYLNEKRNIMFSDDLIDHFLAVFTLEKYLSMKDVEIDKLLNMELPHDMREYSFDDIKEVTKVFGKIVDFKSPFTKNHSFQIADKVMTMAYEYGYDEDTAQRLYIAGALHDIGKMAINNDILEKPAKLSNDEYAYMQNHAWYTYVILKQIKGFDDITRWASLHHEKLNGSGYPFGKTANELDEKERLMGCIDIYQALSEDRPYKKGLPHKECISIMRDMVNNGYIDGRITEDINRVFG